MTENASPATKAEQQETKRAVPGTLGPVEPGGAPGKESGPSNQALVQTFGGVRDSGPTDAHRSASVLRGAEVAEAAPPGAGPDFERLATVLGLTRTISVFANGRGRQTARRHQSLGVSLLGAVHLDSARAPLASELGQRVLAHELAHVAQQRSPSHNGSLIQAEQEARDVSDAFVDGRPVGRVEVGLPLSASATWYPPGEGAAEHPDQTQISEHGFLAHGAAIRLEKLWFERTFGTGGQNAEAMGRILDEVARHPAYAHIQSLTAEERAAANHHIRFTQSPRWDEDHTATVGISRDVYRWIGLPPGIAFQWDFMETRAATEEEPAQYSGRCIVTLEALEAEGEPRQASRALSTQIVDTLAADTGLTPDPVVRNRIIDSGSLSTNLDRSGLAVVIRYNRGDMVVVFGEESWQEFEARRASGEAGEVGGAGGGVAIDESLPLADREFAERFLEELAGPSSDSADSTASSALYVGPNMIAIWRQIDAHPERERIMERLRGGARDSSDDEEQSEENPYERPLSELDRFRLALHAVELDQEYDRLGIEQGDRERAERRAFDFPVEGHIQNHSDLLFVGKTGAFSFTTTIDRDAFAIPWVDVNWVVRRADSRESSGAVLERDHTSHRDYADHAPARFEFEFEEAGIYEINALVDHRFYVPATFTTYVEVKTESERMGEMNARTFGGGVFDTLDEDDPLRERVVEGELAPGECRPGLLVPGDVGAIEQQAERVRQYLASGRINPAAVGPAREYLEAMEETLEEIRREQESGAQSLMIQAAYLSRTAGASSRVLTLVATAQKVNEQWRIGIFDTTQAFDTRNSHYTSEGNTFRAALDDIVGNFAESYPDGTMTVRVETLDDSGEATGRFVSYTIDCYGVWEAIKTTVWDPTVQLVVNIAGAVVMIFAPMTAPVIIPALLVYNAVEVVDRLREFHERDALETTDIAIGIGELAIDLIPYVGRASKLLRVGSRAYYVLEGLELAGDVALMTAGAMEQVQNIRFGAVREAAELHARIQQLEARNPSDPELPALREQFERAQDTSREEFEVFATTVAQQGVMRGSMQTIGHLNDIRTRRVDESRGHLDEAMSSRGDANINADDMGHISTLTGIPVSRGGVGSDVKIQFEVGAHGGITNLRLEVGPDASLAMVRAHEATVQAMHRYEGVTGSLRNLLDRVSAYARGGGHFPPGSRAFEARFELEKLPALVQGFRDRIAGGSLSGASLAEVQRQISSLESQIRQHAGHLDDLAPGLGYVAARGDVGGDATPGARSTDGGSSSPIMGDRPDIPTGVPDVVVAPNQVSVPPERASSPRHQELLQRRGSSDNVLASRPDGWTGRDEAEFRYGPSAIDALPDGYHWSIDAQGLPTVVRTRRHLDNGDLRPRIRYVGEGRFEDVPDTVRRARTRDVENEFHVSDETRAEFDQILQDRERARDARDVAERELQTLADGLALRPEDMDDIDATIERLRREHADDPEMMVRIEELAAKRDELARQRRSVVEQSERLGQRMAEEWIAARYPTAIPLYGGAGAGSRSGDFDQVYLVHGAGRDGRDLIVIVEAKGGSSQLGTRVVEGQREQQGTRNYMRAIAEIMAARSDLPPETVQAMNDIMLHGLVDGPDVQYVLVQAPIGTADGQPVQRPGRVSEFVFDEG